MKKLSKKTIYSFALSAALVLGVYTQIPQEKAIAQAPCSAGQTGGNLYGYLETDNIGYIYLNTETWNEDPRGEDHGTTTETFSVSYDRQNRQFSGRGWNPYVGWVDFGETNSLNSIEQRLEFESMGESDVNGNWGNWEQFTDISQIVYQTDPGGFRGRAFNGDETYLNSENTEFNGTQEDENVGAGLIDFSKVSIVEPECVQYVNLTLNGRSTNLNRESCPVGGIININWASENVEDCRVDSRNWNKNLGDNLPENYTSGSEYTFTGNVTADSPSDEGIVRISCTGINGQRVSDIKNITCGTPTPCDTDANPNCPSGGAVIPTYIEV
jgi:hypothetical protein